MNCLHASVFAVAVIKATTIHLDCRQTKSSRKCYLQHIKALLGITKTTLKPSGVSQRSDWYRGTSVLEESAASSNVANESSTFLHHSSNNLSVKTTISHDAVHRLEFSLKKNFRTWTYFNVSCN